MIGLVNYNGGNYRSVYNALKYLSINFIEIKNHKDLKNISHIILPGVGSYSYLVENLKSKNLFHEILNEVKNNDVFYLGICVGMQILSKNGSENYKTNGFNLINGIVEKMPVKKEVLPNIGWHQIILEKKNSLLFKDVYENEMFFYFLHSYYFKLNNQKYCSSNIQYENKITASVETQNIFRVQFHPEKSQIGGLKILKNFCNL